MWCTSSMANIKIDDDLVDEALKLSGCRTRQEVATLALEEFVAHRRRLQILELRGCIDFDPSFDYKKHRER